MVRVRLFGFLLLGGGAGLWLLTHLLGASPSPPPEPAWDDIASDTGAAHEPTEGAGARLMRAVRPFSPADLEAGRIPPEALRDENEDGLRVYASSIGPIALTASFAQRGDPDSVKQLGEAMKKAQDWGKAVSPDAQPWTFESLGPLGGYLRHTKLNVIACDATVLQAQAVPARETEAEIQRIRAAAQALMNEVRGSTAVEPWMTEALGAFLAHLDDPPASEPGAGMDPDFARRIVSDPEWLRSVVPAASATARDAVVKAVRAARTLHPTARYERGPGCYTYLGDAWRERGMQIRIGPLSAYVRRPPLAFQAPGRYKVLRTCRLLYLLPDHADAIPGPKTIQRSTAFFLREGTLLASWDGKEETLGLDYNAWRRAFPRYRLPIVSGHWPMHMPIVGADGTLHGIGTPRGFLRAPRRGSKAEADRFVAGAVRMLPTAAHLDLLQQYYVRYCFDSPSIAIPTMVGIPGFSADIHQTAEQVVASAAGGVCRGDCDDFAELCQTIANRQGKLAHVIALPRHLATMWAEKWGEQWRAYVLQTGYTLEFRGSTLHEALRRAYLHLAPDKPLDRDNVSLSLRFAGENTRSTFGLPARVFEDARYAKTMVELQGDWHAHRYLRVLRRVRVLAKEDASAGTLVEHASICERLGRYVEAADLRKRLLEAAADPESHALRKIAWASTLMLAERQAEARAAVAELLDSDLPAVADKLGLRTLPTLLRLADSLSSDPPLAARVLSSMIHFKLPDLDSTLADLLHPDAPAEPWRKHKHHKRLQEIATDLTWSFIGVLDEARGGKHAAAVSKELEPVARAVDVWLDRFALDGVDEPRAIDRRWTLRATRRLASEPGFLERILTATPMDAISAAPAQRGVAAATLASRARTSVRFLAAQLIDAACDESAPDAGRARRLLEAMADATRVQQRLGLRDAAAMNLHQRGCLAAALIARDEKAVQDALLELRLLDNRFDTSRAAYMLGRFARHSDAAWWKRLTRAWIDAMPRDTNDCRIVWTAYKSGARKHALAMAAAAARRSQASPGLREEARLFAAFVAKSAKSGGH